MLKIVGTQKAHLEHLLKLGEEHWAYEDWLNLKFLKNTLNKKGLHFTALLDGKIAGCIMVVEEDYPKSWLYYFVVAKEHQRKSVGKALLNKVESKLKKGEILFVDLEKSDSSGMNFYLKNEFRIMGHVTKWFEGKRNGIILAKKV